MFGRVNVAQVRLAREALLSGSAREICALLCEIGGPLHPGQAQRAKEPWVGKGGQLAAVAIEAILTPAVEQRDRRAPGRRERLDLDRVKDWVTHWISHGSLPSGVRDTGGAAEIAGFLQEQARDAGSQDAAVDADAAQHGQQLRLAVVAATAPALESMLVMSRMSESLLTVLESQPRSTSADGASAGEQDIPGVRDGVATAGPMARDERDDEMTRSAFGRLLGAFGLGRGESPAAIDESSEPAAPRKERQRP